MTFHDAGGNGGASCLGGTPRTSGGGRGFFVSLYWLCVTALCCIGLRIGLFCVGCVVVCGMERFF
jgi:hypothetical protein